LKAAEDLAQRSPDKGYARAPEALRRLIFPTPYADVMLQQANEYDVEPLALYAMLRQESLFNPGAQSVAGAMGLAQVMPATAQGIAQNLEVSGFEEADLLRPAISIRFGAFYLGHQLDMMEGSLPAALAAYNGGPGNATRWAGGNTVADPDLFSESIDYNETRGYVKLVYGYYGAYQRLYKAP
jgi:soluble lytic murein transglycosylase